MSGEFGRRVRERRSAAGMTLGDLAGASGVSVSMVSQVERGQREPTLPVAQRIADGLGCHLSDLLDGPPPRAFELVRLAESSGTEDPETGVRRLLLSRHLPPSLAEVAWYRVPPGASVGPFVHRKAGLLEQLTVVAGQLNVTVGREVHRLRAGDTLTYPGHLRHRFVNPGRTEASFVHLAHPYRGAPVSHATPVAPRRRRARR